MANTDGQIVLGLDIPKSAKQINADIKKLQNQLAQIKITGALDTGAAAKQINGQIAKLKAQLKKIAIPLDSNPMDRLKADIKELAGHLKTLPLENTALAHFKTDIDGVETSLDSLIRKLSAVDRAADLAALRSQAEAFKTTFSQLAQIDINTVTDKFSSLSTINTIVNSIATANELG